MKTYFFTYCLSFLLATAMTPIVILWAQRRGLVDKPDGRKIHTVAIPRVGELRSSWGPYWPSCPYSRCRIELEPSSGQ